MQDINRITKRGNWAQDNLGTQVPMSHGSDAKVFMELPFELKKYLPAANALIRGNLPREIWPLLSLISTLAADHEPSIRFVISVGAGSMSENGQATTNALQSSVQMLAVPALSPTLAHPQRNRNNGHKSESHDGRVIGDE